MSYATEAQFGALGLPAAASDGFDVQDYLDTAFGVVNSYLRGRYKLPLASSPGELVSAECRIAAYELLCVRGFDPTNPGDDNVRRRHDDAMRWLRDLAGGKVNLDLAVDATPGTHDGGPRVRSRPVDYHNGVRRSWCQED